MRPTHTRPQRTDDPWGRYAYATDNSNPGSVSPISALANLDLTPGPYTDTMEKSRHEPEITDIRVGDVITVPNVDALIREAERQVLLCGFLTSGKLDAMTGEWKIKVLPR